jgi:hypothetical protein
VVFRNLDGTKAAPQSGAVEPAGQSTAAAADSGGRRKRRRWRRAWRGRWRGRASRITLTVDGKDYAVVEVEEDRG